MSGLFPACPARSTADLYLRGRSFVLMVRDIVNFSKINVKNR